jgi:hypothetical protein
MPSRKSCLLILGPTLSYAVEDGLSWGMLSLGS